MMVILQSIVFILHFLELERSLECLAAKDTTFHVVCLGLMRAALLDIVLPQRDRHPAFASVEARPSNALGNSCMTPKQAVDQARGAIGGPSDDGESPRGTL